MTKISKPIFAIKIDVDTERGTHKGVPNLRCLLKKLQIPATFFFSLGRDNTGRALKRIFRPGFLAKVARTNVVGTYGIATLMNGLILPGPHIGKKHEDLMRQVQADGFSVGIHAFDHQRWQDGIMKMSSEETGKEFSKAMIEFQRIFSKQARAFAAPGWQTNAKTLAIYDKYKLLYASDCRGMTPFFPRVNKRVFRTLQIPTTLPTLDELLGLPEFPLSHLINYYTSLLNHELINVLTIHAEIEGMKYFDWFQEFLMVLKKSNIQFRDLPAIANQLLKNPKKIPICKIINSKISGRSGTVAMQSD